MTTLRICNWSGITVSVYCNGLTQLIRPTGPSPTTMTPPGQHPNSTVTFSVVAGDAVNGQTATPVLYSAGTDGTSSLDLTILSNTRFPSAEELQCTGSGGTCNNYSYSGGYAQADSYIVQGLYYSPAVNYTFPTSMTVVEVAGASYARLTLVADAFRPVVTDCASCTVCKTCPTCSQCPSGKEDDESGTSWYWWALIVVAIVAVLLLGVAGLLWWRRRSIEMDDV